MPSKNEIIVAVIGLAIVGFIVYYFFYRNKTLTPSTQSTSPLTTISSDISGFVSGVQNAFNKVLGAGGTIMSDVRKDIGWGEKLLGNTVGIISSGASMFGKTVVSDTEHFVRGVENVFGDVGKTLSTGVSTAVKNLEDVGIDVEKTGGKIFFGKLESGVSQTPKEIVSGAKTLGSDVERGVNGFVNDVKSFLLRF